MTNQVIATTIPLIAIVVNCDHNFQVAVQVIEIGSTGD